jgi:hypothetical protein
MKERGAPRARGKREGPTISSAASMISTTAPFALENEVRGDPLLPESHPEH